MAVWDIPVGKGRKYVPTGWVDQIIGGWTTVPGFVIQSGVRFTPIYTGSDPTNVGTSSGRPDQTCDANGFGDGPGIIWDRSCFAVPQPGRYGNTARGILAGPVTWQADFNLFKNWYLTPHEAGPYFKLEMYATNIFNHRNSSGPQSTNIRQPELRSVRSRRQPQHLFPSPAGLLDTGQYRPGPNLGEGPGLFRIPASVRRNPALGVRTFPERSRFPWFPSAVDSCLS
jgi:hypothetical protein